MGRMSGVRAGLRKLVVIITVVWPKSCLKTYVLSTPNCAHMVSVSGGTVEESLLRKKMSWVLVWATFLGICEQGRSTSNWLGPIFEEKSGNGQRALGKLLVWLGTQNCRQRLLSTGLALTDQVIQKQESTDKPGDKYVHNLLQTCI